MLQLPACPYCFEPMEPEGRTLTCMSIVGGGTIEIDLHYECGVRVSIGSAAHQLGECSCFGGTREDPPQMSKREAAKLACEAFLLLESQVS